MVKFITKGIDKVFTTLNVGAHQNVFAFHMLILFINICVSIFPIVMYYFVATNVHIVFWMGKVPQFVNLLVPGAMVFLNFGVTMFQCCNLRPTTAKVWCFTLFISVGCVLVAGGAYVLQLADAVTEDLVYNCGSTLMTKRIQQEWEHLHAFWDKCAEEKGERPGYIQQCPGFEEAFAGNIYVKYIEDMEFDYNCQGFCRFWSKPLFNQDANPGKRCASSIGQEVEGVGNMVGIPTIMTGAIIVLLGILLSGYDHI